MSVWGRVSGDATRARDRFPRADVNAAVPPFDFGAERDPRARFAFEVPAASIPGGDVFCLFAGATGSATLRPSPRDLASIERRAVHNACGEECGATPTIGTTGARSSSLPIASLLHIECSIPVGGTSGKSPPPGRRKRSEALIADDPHSIMASPGCTLRMRWAKEVNLDFARRANPICQGFAQSLAGKHDSSDVNRLVDLGPMSRVKDVKSGIPGLGSHVLGDGDMKIGVKLSPNE